MTQAFDPATHHHELKTMLAERVPFSGYFGGGVIFKSPSGKPMFQIVIMGISDGINDIQRDYIAERLISGWNDDTDPMVIALLSQQVNELQERLKNTSELQAERDLADQLAMALRFYADEENHTVRSETLSCGCCSDIVESKVDEDNGNRARETLTRAQEALESKKQ